MKHLFKTVLTLLMPVILFAQDDLEKTSLLNDKIEMLVPKSFHRMTEAEYKIKYPNPQRKASLIMTDKNLEVNLVINYMTQYPLREEDLEEFKNAQLAVMQKAHPEGKLLGNGIKEVNGAKIGFFKILIPASDQKVFNYFVFTSLDGKVLLFNFNCTEKLLPAWEKSIESMVNSLKLSK